MNDCQLALRPAGTSSPSQGRLGRQLLALSIAGFVAVTVLSYVLKWSWTGFSGNGTVWDWLSLFLLPIAVALVPFMFEAST